jgi:hypothetical protein
MSKSSKLDRVGALMGIAFVALLVTFRVIEGSGGLPASDASQSTVVEFWTQHRGEQIAVAILASLGAVVFTWFAGVMRSALVRAEGGQATYANLSFGGAIVAAVGMLAISTVEYTAANSAGHVPGSVTQTLSALQADNWLGFAAGAALYGLATGVAILRTQALPRWQGYVAVASGFFWLTPAQPIGLLLTLVLLVASSVVLYRRFGAGSALTPAPSAA